jgi:hypothetical protein
MKTSFSKMLTPVMVCLTMQELKTLQCLSRISLDTTTTSRESKRTPFPRKCLTKSKRVCQAKYSAKKILKISKKSKKTPKNNKKTKKPL